MKFREVKDDIRKGNNVEYYTTWYNYNVHIDVFEDDIYYILTQGINKAFCRIDKEEFMKMNYKDLIRALKDTLHLFNVY